MRTILFLSKFLMSGGLSALVLYMLLFLFHTYLELSVVLSSTLAYALSMGVGFSAQKFWTFRDREGGVVVQFSKYASLGVFNIGANAYFMYFLSQKLFIHYAIAQLLSLSVITVWSFFYYKKFVFQRVVKVNTLLP